MTRPTPTRWDIRDVLARTDLAALLDEHTIGVGSGHRRRWHCPHPDHDDRHASVTIRTDAAGHQRWRCWSGDHTHRGDAVDLVCVVRGVARGDALDLLARRAGLHPDHPGPGPALVPPRPSARPAVAPVVGCDPVVGRYVAACEAVLWTRTGKAVRDWLADRGFTEATVRANHVGADPGRTQLPRRRGLPTGRSVAATFPALGPRGDVTYVQTRYLTPGERPKYENPAARIATNPRLAWATPPAGASRGGLLVVCEGIPDALTAAQAGHHAVAVLGAQTPDAGVAADLARHAASRPIVAIGDADPAGRKWTRHLAGLLRARGVDLVVLEPPAGHDLNSWARHHPDWHHNLPPPTRALHRDTPSYPPPGPDLGLGP